MAEARTSMVSFLDIGTLNGGNTPNIVELGDGFNDISEDWGPDVQSTQYVNMDSKSSTLKGYDFSVEAEREYLADDVQTAIDELFKDLPTGSKCNTFYYRYFKKDIVFTSGTGTGTGIKLPVIVAPSKVGGKGGDVLTSTIKINGNGNPVKQTVSIAKDGKATFANVV